jgi:hypothetical protein
MSDAFDPDWLAVREPHDAAARSHALAARLIATLPRRPVLVDLGAGTGAMFRWLAPMIGRSQAWTFVDVDRALLDEAFSRTADWAKRRGWAVTFPGRAMLVHAPGGACRIEAIEADLADPDELPLEGVDAVVCSALIDLVSARWIEELVARLDSPLFAALGVDGRDAWLPAHPADRLVRHGLRLDQVRDKGFGPALGVRAPALLRRALTAQGFRVSSAPSDWRISPTALAMLRELISTTADAAEATRPASASAIASWRAARLRQAAAERLVVRIGHRDILAFPAHHTGQD